MAMGYARASTVRPSAVVDPVPPGLQVQPLPDQPDEVLGAAGQLEADQVGTEQPLQDLVPPRQLVVELGGRERDVQEEADPQVGSQLPQHLRHQLELVVLHPDHRTRRGDLGRPRRRSAG